MISQLEQAPDTSDKFRTLDAETDKLVDRIEYHEHNAGHKTFMLIGGEKFNHIELHRLCMILTKVVNGDD